jgi:hypothetical protein
MYILTKDLQSFRNYISDLTFLHHTYMNPKTIAARNRPIPNSYTYSPKNKSRFKLPHTRTSLRQKSFFIRATREFNKLPTELQDSVCNHNFRRELWGGFQWQKQSQSRHILSIFKKKKFWLWKLSARFLNLLQKKDVKNFTAF